jgi:hypothetical protein
MEPLPYALQLSNLVPPSTPQVKHPSTVFFCRLQNINVVCQEPGVHLVNFVGKTDMLKLIQRIKIKYRKFLVAAVLWAHHYDQSMNVAAERVITTLALPPVKNNVSVTGGGGGMDSALFSGWDTQCAT